MSKSKSNSNSKSKSKSKSKSNRSKSSVRQSSRLTPVETKERELHRLLAEGAYHLPGRTWWQDWRQYFGNNHPLFAPCFQHHLHPISKAMRAVGILGSIAVGLIVTNIVFMIFIHDNDAELDDTMVFQVSAGGFVVANGTSFVYLDEEDSSVAQYTSVQVSSGMLLLWSVGAAVHALFDNTIWYVTSCACLPGESRSDVEEGDEVGNDDAPVGGFRGWVHRHRRLTNLLVLLLVLLILVIATLAVVIRATIEGGEQDVDATTLSSLTSEGIDPDQVKNKENYEFLLSYSVELALAWFFWFPVIETVLFSGILSCGGRLSFLGGRPAEIRQEEETRQLLEEAEQGGRLKKKQGSSQNNTSERGKSGTRDEQARRSMKKQGK